MIVLDRGGRGTIRSGPRVIINDSSSIIKFLSIHHNTRVPDVEAISGSAKRGFPQDNLPNALKTRDELPNHISHLATGIKQGGEVIHVQTHSKGLIFHLNSGEMRMATDCSLPYIWHRASLCETVIYSRQKIPDLD